MFTERIAFLQSKKMINFQKNGNFFSFSLKIYSETNPKKNFFLC